LQQGTACNPLALNLNSLGDEETPAFLFQPEALLIYSLLSSARDKTRKVWNESYPEDELERIANAFGARSITRVVLSSDGPAKPIYAAGF